MSSVNPPHRLTPSALAAARCLASDLFPVTDAQIDAQTDIYRAIEAGQLYDVLEAMNQARRYGTRTWRNWEADLVAAVERHILKDLHSTRREAA